MNRELALRENKPDFEAVVEALYEAWQDLNEKCFSGEFHDKDVPLILIESQQSEMKADKGFVGVGEFRFSTIQDEAIIPSIHPYDDAKGVDYDPYIKDIPTYSFSEHTLTGDDGILKAGTILTKGWFRYMKDKMLHEMVHHRVYKMYGCWDHRRKTGEELNEEREVDDQYSTPGKVDWFGLTEWRNVRLQHTKYFCEICNQVCDKLGLPRVEYYVGYKDHKANPKRSCVNFVTNVRPKDYYLDAVARWQW